MGFALFAENKPDARLYLHMGTRDAGWEILRLAKRYGIDNKLIISGIAEKIQQLPVEHLNKIYNACDVGINTSLGKHFAPFCSNVN